MHFDQAEPGELGTRQDRAEDATLSVSATATRQIHVGAVAPQDLGVGVEQQGIEVGQAGATAHEQ